MGDKSRNKEDQESGKVSTTIFVLPDWRGLRW
jgi:hypothetical protein